MISKEHSKLKLFDFSIDWTQINFDNIDLNKPISNLTLTDLIWCLRKRKFTEQVIVIVLDKIRENWTYIDQYYIIQ